MKRQDPRLTLLEHHIPHAAGHYIRKTIEERKKKREAQVPSEREVQTAQNEGMDDTTSEEIGENEVEAQNAQGPEESPEVEPGMRGQKPPPVIPSESAERKKYKQIFGHMKSKPERK